MSERGNNLPGRMSAAHANGDPSVSIAIQTLHSRHATLRAVPTSDLVTAIAITGTLMLATATTAVVGPMPRTGAAILDLGLLSLAGRRYQPLPAAVATIVVVITSVLTAPEAVKAPVLAAVALVAYSLVRYESGSRLLTGLLVCIGGVGVARFVLPADHAHGVNVTQLEVVLVLLPAVTAALIRVRGRLPGLLLPDLHARDLTGAVAAIDGEPAADHLLGIGRGLHRIASWLEFGRVNRDRMLSTLAAGLVLLVLLLHGGDTGVVARDLTVVGLAVIAVGSVALVGRWPGPALLMALAAAVSFTGIASLPDAYNSVIGGVVVIGLPLMMGGMLRRRPALITLGACAAGVVIMGLVARSAGVPPMAASTTGQEVLSSVALVIGAWSAGRVVRRGCEVAWTGARPLRPAARWQRRLLPDAAELVYRVGMLGLRPTTIRVDPMPAGGSIPNETAELAGQLLDEALANAARYAPGAELMIKVQPDRAAIRIEVINGPPIGEPGDSAVAGRGVPVLAARVAAIGGMFAVGPASGGFALRARLPIKAVDRRTATSVRGIGTPAR